MYIPQPIASSAYLFEITIAYEGDYATAEIESPSMRLEDLEVEIDEIYPGGVLIRSRLLGHIEPPSDKTLEELFADFEEIYARSKAIA